MKKKWLLLPCVLLGDRFRVAALEGDLTHDANPILAAHVGHAIAKTTPYGTVVTKSHPDSPRRIDAAVAAIIAYERAVWHRQNVEEIPPPMFAWG